MKRAERDEWTYNLRNPEVGGFKQGRSYLNKGSEQCCIGVKCELDYRKGRMLRELHAGMYSRFAYAEPSATSAWAWSRIDFPSGTMTRLGITDAIQSKLIDMNDNRVPWPEIADWIDQNVPVED